MPDPRVERALLVLSLAGLAVISPGCKGRTFSIDSRSPWAPGEIAERLGCTPERNHDTWVAGSTRFDGECDMKVDAVRYLQAARHLGRLPGAEDQASVGVLLDAEGVEIGDIGPSIRFAGFEIVSALRGPHVLRVALAPDRFLAFCCDKVKACSSEAGCTCQNDCHGE